MRVKSYYHSEHIFQHIAIDTFVRGYVLCPALKDLFAESLAVKAHIVKVCPCVIDDVKAVCARFVPCKAHTKSFPISVKSLLPVITAKRLPPICSKKVFAIISVFCLWLAVRTPTTCSTFGYLGNGCMVLQPFHQTLHIVLARYDCRVRVNGGKPATRIVIYPLFEGCHSPKLRIAEDAVQLRYRFFELDDYRLIGGCVHRLSSFPRFLSNHLSLSARHSSNVGFTQENNSISVWR